MRRFWLLFLIPFFLIGYWLTPRVAEPVFKPRPTAELEQLMQGAFVAARPAMLQLQSLSVSSDDQYYYSRSGRASAFLISASGYALTAYHAVIGIDKLEVLTTKQELFPARVIGWDESRDLALIQVSANRLLEFLPIEFHKAAEINDPIVEIGNSGEDFIQPRYGAIQGYIQEQELLIPTRMMLSNVPINPGDSGGAVLNFAGKIIGMGIGYAQDENARVSFLVPFFGLDPWLEQMKTGAKLKLPGVGIRVSQNARVQGLDIDLIEKNSVAAKAGLTLDIHGENQLLELDGKPVETLRDYHRIMRQKKIGESIIITVTIRGKEQTLTLQVE